MRKGFFLLFEFLIALLLFSSVFFSASIHSSENSSNYRLSEVVCTDLLSIWLLGEDDLQSIASEMLPQGSFSFSSIPLYSKKSHSFSCFAQRMRNGALENQYIIIEW